MREREMVQELLKGREPDAFAATYREIARESSMPRVLIREAASSLARGMSWTSRDQGTACFHALMALQVVDQTMAFMAQPERVRVLGQAIWFVARCVEATPQRPAANSGLTWQGANHFTSLLTRGDLASAGPVFAAGIADPASRAAAENALLTFALPNFSGFGISFLGTHKVLEMIDSAGFEGTLEHMVPLVHVACLAPQDRGDGLKIRELVARRGTELAELPIGGAHPTGEQLASIEEGLREGSEPAVEAIADAALANNGWACAWEGILLALTRLIGRAGPRSMIDGALAFSYLTAVRAASRQRPKVVGRAEGVLLSVPLFLRLQRGVTLERARQPSTGGAGTEVSLDEALDSGDGEAAREAVETLIESNRSESVREPLMRRAVLTDDPLDFVTRLHYVAAAVGTHEGSPIPGRGRHLSTLASFLARCPKESRIHDRLARVRA